MKQPRRDRIKSARAGRAQRLLAALTALLLIAALAQGGPAGGAALAQAADAAARQGVVNAQTKVSLREAADPDSERMAYLAPGDAVQVIGENGDWYQVTVNGLTGYVHKTFLTVAQSAQVPASQPTPTAAPGAVLVTIIEGVAAGEAGVPIYREPRLASEEVGVLAAGEASIVIGAEEEWYQVVLGTISGYVEKGKITVRQRQVEATDENAVAGGNAFELVTVIQGTVDAREGASVNVRESASAGDGVKRLGKVGAGDTLTVTGETGDWYEVEFEGQVGYISKEFMTTREYQQLVPRSTAAPEEDGYVTQTVVEGTVDATARVNVRERPDTDSKKIGALSPGDVVTVVDVEEDWYKIEFEGSTGYIKKTFLVTSTRQVRVTATPSAQASTPTASAEAADTPPPVGAGSPGADATPEVEMVTVAVLEGTVSAKAELNVREQPDAQAKKLGALEPGATIEIEGESGDWYQVTYEGQAGYVAKEYVATREVEKTVPRTPAPPTPDPAAQDTLQAGYEWATVLMGAVSVDASINVREAANAESERLGVLAPGESAMITGSEGDWYQIVYEGGVGYVSAAYVVTREERRQVPIAAATPTPAPSADPTPLPDDVQAFAQATDEPDEGEYVFVTVIEGTVVANAHVNVRELPDASSKKLASLAPDTVVAVLGEEGDWLNIEHDGVSGYMKSDFVKTREYQKKVPIEELTPTPSPTAAGGATDEPEGAGSDAPVPEGYQIVTVVEGTVNANARVYVRSGAGSDFESLGKLSPGDLCTVTGKEGDWYQIEFEGAMGYVHGDFLTTREFQTQAPIPSATPSASEAPEEDDIDGEYELVTIVEGTVDAEAKVYVRSGPGPDYRTLGKLSPGDTLIVSGESGDWYQVDFEGTVGYVNKQFMKVREYQKKVAVVVEDPLAASVYELGAPTMLERGQEFALSGIVVSNIPLTSVAITVYNEHTLAAELSVKRTLQREDDVKEYDLQPLSEALAFGDLAAGEKRLVVVITSANEQLELVSRRFTVLGAAAEAAHITGQCSLYITHGRSSHLTDGEYDSAWEPASASDELSISIPAGVNAGALSIEWRSIPSAYTISLKNEAGEIVKTFTAETKYTGLNSHYKLDNNVRSISVTLSDLSSAVCEVRVYESGKTSIVTEQWEQPPQDVDLMVVVAYPGEELMYFGGAIPAAIAQGKSVTVVYMADRGRERASEALRGLWSAGVRTAPLFLNLPYDEDIEDYEAAVSLWGLEPTVEKLVALIQHYQPKVLLTHDLEGEDGNSFNRFTSATLRRAVLLATDPEAYPNLSAQYGTWDTPKVYVHRYTGNQVTMNWQTALSHFDGRSALEMATIGLDKHRSLLDDDFSMKTGEKYDYNLFGLIRTTIGDDVYKKDFFENIN